MGGWGATTPADYIGFGLTFLALISTAFGIWLTRRGKREENTLQGEATRIADRDSAFDGMVDLAKNRLDEIASKNGEIRDLREQLATVRADAEARWSRQMERCRQITDTASTAISRLQDRLRDQGDKDDAARAIRAIDDHNETDHPKGAL